ncbi:hypothetical protein GCM10009529_06000 [Micropruina glycogenica]
MSGVTARAVAAQLGVRPSALYHHLPDMATLLDQMATAMRRDLVLQPVTGWRELLLETGRVLRRALLAHRDGGRLFAGRRLPDPSLLTAMEEPLRSLVEAGFSLEQAVTALQAVLDLTIGFVIEEQHRASGESGEYDPELRRLLSCGAIPADGGRQRAPVRAARSAFRERVGSCGRRCRDSPALSLAVRGGRDPGAALSINSIDTCFHRSTHPQHPSAVGEAARAKSQPGGRVAA